MSEKREPMSGEPDQQAADERTEAFIREAVAKAPPLSEEARSRLRTLFA